MSKPRRLGQIVKKAGQNNWLVRIYKGEDPITGKRGYLNFPVKGTRKDAERELHRLSMEQEQGTLVEPNALTLDAYLDRWLETAETKLGARTFQDYSKVLQRYIRPTLGAQRLNKLTSLAIQGVYAGMQARGLSPRTVRYAHTVLSSALTQAVKWRLLTVNPAKAVDLPKNTQHKEMHAMTPEEATRFLDAAAMDRWGILFAFSLVTGMRPGEVLALRWRDVDFEAGTVAVRRALITLGGKHAFGEPKTPRSRRTIPLPNSMVRDLKHHKAEQALERAAAGSNWEDGDLVFASSDGTPLNERNLVQRHFKPILKAAGLPKEIRMYDLRHTCATLLLSQEVNPKVVSERLGHASITLTLDTYSHVLPTMQKAAADKLEQLLFRDK